MSPHAPTPPPPAGTPPAGLFQAILTIAIGASLAAAAHSLGSFGFVFLLAAPFTLGFASGYFAENSGLGCFGYTVLISAVVALISYLTESAGLFCLSISMTLGLAPLFIGTWVGADCRSRWKRARMRVPLALFLATLGGLWLEPGLTPPHAPETVVTAQVLPMDRLAAWNAIVFYEDVDAPPPLLTRIGLPRPLGTTGVPDEVGARTRCDYTTGQIEKLITELRTGELLAFEVTRQEGVEDHSVELLSGSFTFEDAPEGGTLVTLRTTYRPLLDGRFAWRPIERAVCRDLHLHVLGGMALQRPAPELPNLQ